MSEDNYSDRKYNHYETTKDILNTIHNEDIIKSCQTVAKFTCYLVKQHIMPPEIAKNHCNDLMKMCEIYTLMKAGTIKTDDSLPAFREDISVKDGHLDTDEIDKILDKTKGEKFGI